ncbi:MAG: Alpha/beta hydrolase fold-3 domain protein [Microbacteriaceae bacterium]|nr:Alpha/beta hydrolase fold-3 domain protein [Microbacteriaceae bacterium]
MTAARSTGLAAQRDLEITLRFHHAEKSSELARLHATEADVAPIVARELGLTLPELAAERRALELLAASAALEVLARPGIAELVRDLPFRTGATIVVIGDSLSDDVLSWANQLSTLLATALPERRLRVVNAGRSGDTTAEVIARLDAVVAERPAWVLQLLGTNDARRHGLAAHAVFTAEQTAHNFETIRDILRTETQAMVVRMTPPAIDVDRISTWEPFTAQHISWRPEDVRRIGDELLAADPTTIDLGHALDAADALGPDGLHASLAGHQAILETLVRRLSI